VDSLQLQFGTSQRRGGKEFCEAANMPGLALPFFSRDDDGCKFAVTSDGLRAPGTGTVQDLTEFSLSFGYSPLALGQSETSL
jgi:hypothetical protein